MLILIPLRGEDGGCDFVVKHIWRWILQEGYALRKFCNNKASLTFFYSKVFQIYLAMGLLPL